MYKTEDYPDKRSRQDMAKYILRSSQNQERSYYKVFENWAFVLLVSAIGHYLDK